MARKPGRPKGSTQGKKPKPRTSFMIEQPLLDKVRHFAQIDNRTASSVIEMCVRYSIDRLIEFKQMRGDLVEQIRVLADTLGVETDDPRKVDLVGQMTLFDQLVEMVEERESSRRE